MSIPTSIASMLALRNAIMPSPTKTYVMPDSSRQILRILFVAMDRFRPAGCVRNTRAPHRVGLLGWKRGDFKVNGLRPVGADDNFRAYITEMCNQPREAAGVRPVAYPPRKQSGPVIEDAAFRGTHD